MYIINEETKSPNTGVSFIEAGIHENLELVELTYKKNEETGTQFLAFYWEDQSGARVSKTEWEPKAPQFGPDFFFKTEADAQKALMEKVRNQSYRIKHMLEDSGILEKGALNINAKDFEDYAQQIIKAVGDKNKGKKARLKVVYDDKNYTTLPTVAKNLEGSYCWVESMDVPKEESKIKILGMDKMSRLSPDNITGESSPFDKESTSEDIPQTPGSEDDLPF